MYRKLKLIIYYFKPFSNEPPPNKSGFRRFYEFIPNKDKYKSKFVKV